MDLLLFMLGIPLGMLFFLGLFIAFAFGFNYFKTKDLIKQSENEDIWP